MWHEILTGNERKDEHKDCNVVLDPSVSDDGVGEDVDEDEDPFRDWYYFSFLVSDYTQ